MLGSGTENDPYIIEDVTDLQNVSNDLTAWYELRSDIDASATSGWNAGKGFEPIGNWVNHGGTPPTSPYIGCAGTFFKQTPFTGHFDGRGYKVINIFMHWCRFDAPVTACPYYYHIGLFSSLGSGAIVQNLGLESCSIKGYDEAGAIAGMTEDNPSGTIRRSMSDGTIEVEDDSAGGIVGESAYATFEKSYSLCTVIGGDDDIGGFVGQSYGDKIEDCYARGNVTGDRYVGGFVGGAFSSDIDNIYSTGLVVGNNDVGGLLGYNSGSDVDNSFWDTETSGQSSSAGGTGKTTTLMKIQSTFTRAGWAFNVIWGMTDVCNAGYPCLLNVTPYCTVIVPEVREDALQDIVTLEAIRNVEMMGMGRFYIDEDGKAVYESRHNRSI